jgi:alkylation response protein AidB-like acyl-CoA dehydrogenase
VGGAVVGVLRLADAAGLADDSYTLDTIGALVVTGHALAVLGYRLTLSALGGADPSGSEAAVRKLLGVQQEQRVQEVGVELCGPAATRADGAAQAWIATFLFNRCLSIAGGTTEIQKNVIAERLLGLPRD